MGDMDSEVLVKRYGVKKALEMMDAEIERLQRIIDSRPANNEHLHKTYPKWSQGIYTLDIIEAFGVEKQ